MVLEKVFLKEKNKCNGCSACANICPKNCITMVPDELGFLYPQVDDKLCVNCSLCEKVCPVFNKVEVQSTPKTYAIKNKNNDIRLQSSSGGVFTAIANEILRSNGVVFGVAFSDDFKSVEHLAVESAEDLSKLRGSKYVQSRVEASFSKVKTFLDNNRKVLFTGTPCQIEGLLSYLKKDYPNLYTQDIVCHGVPSPFVWKKYVEFREEKAGARVTDVTFRNKSTGWATYSVQMKFDNNAEYFVPISQDPYMKGFLDNTYLRSSCYDCAFKTTHRKADITLADFWGVWNIHPEMNDNKGTSLVIVNSEKGEELLNCIANQVEIIETDVNEAVKFNSAAIKSVPHNPKRAEFIKDFNCLEFEKVLKKYCSPDWKKQLKSKIKSLIKR